MSAYATFVQYKARQGVDDSQKSRVEEQLLAMSRYLDLKLNMVPGGFAPIPSESFLFEGRGGDTLYLRDGEGAVYPLRSVDSDGIRPDYERSGDYSTTHYKWDLDDPFIWPIPRNGAAIERPFRALQLRRVGSSPATIWPYSDGAVQITGDWGWAMTPGPIRELVIYLARDIADSQQGGAAAVLAPLDQGVPLQDDTGRLWRMVEQQYSQGKLVRYGMV